jgi:hypothetical protein
MFLGHFALGFALKGVEPRVSLATGFLAAQLADTLWPAMLLLGVERVTIAPGDTAVTPLRFDSYPWSHSLLTLCVLGLGFACIHLAFCRRARAAVLLGLLVVSHWFLDFVSHRPDMPLSPWSSERFGLGLWDSVLATVVVEFALLAGGVAIAVNATTARDGVGRWGFVGLVVFLAGAYLGALLGPPPPSAQALAWVSVFTPPILMALAAWVDRHRQPVLRRPGTLWRR